MKIVYNNKSYHFSRYQTVDDLLKQKSFLELPLNIWTEVLLQKEGSYSLMTLQKILLAKIEYYDSSENVNSFIFQGNPCWLDKNTRVGLVNLANSTSEPVSLFLDPNFIELDPQIMKQYLAQIEIYASKCYINTQRHLQCAKLLRTESEMLDYDYTTGYPDKITLE